MRALRIAGILLAGIAGLDAQVCRLSVAGVNQNRRVIGPVSAECPGSLHTAPFGNWGVTSNFGAKRDGHQFDGWCQNRRICDNLGICRDECKTDWFEWNSCTTSPLFQPPNCTLYNASNCTEQVSTTGVNVLGTQVADVPVSCPTDMDGDGRADAGGCSDLRNYSHAPNFMTIYELDPGTADELIQTLHYPDTPVPLNCSVYGCPAAGSVWAAPSAYESPTSPPKVYAEMATVVNSGYFSDPNGTCRAVVSGVACVSAATFRGPVVAAGSIASVFGRDLAASTATAPPPDLAVSLAGVTARVADSSGTERIALLYFVSPQQINLLVPAQSSHGPAVVTVRNGSQVAGTGAFEVSPVSPGLFSGNASGQGVAAAVAVKYGSGRTEEVQAVLRCGSAPGSCVSMPLELGEEEERLYLLLFGTGIRGRSSLAGVEVRIGGVGAVVEYAGPQPTYEGLDQVNVRVPRSLAGRGEVEIALTVDGIAANTVTVNIR